MAKDKSQKNARSFKLTADEKSFDPTLASLFAKSSGPIQPRPKSAYEVPLPKTSKIDEEEPSDEEEDEAAEEDDEELSSIDEELDDGADEEEGSDEEMVDVEDAESEAEEASIPAEIASVEKSQRKRKRKGDEEDLEDKYMRKLAKEEAKEEAKLQAERSKKRLKKLDGEAEDKSEEQSGSDAGSDAEAANGEDVSDEESDFEIPQHETIASEKKQDTELDKASRTVFLGNVSIEAITSKSDKKTLLNHMSSFLSELPAHTPPHKLESMRFRSTAYSTMIPKKGAFAQKELMEATTKSTNAYVVYTTQQAAREAARRLNGTVVLDRHLRVDEVAHPAKQDHRRCVFVGNLGFVDDENMIREAEAEKTGKTFKKKEPGDVEEGLWRQFGKAGTVESVRVVRDPKTRVGKGFAYVQFKDENAVEAALLFNDKRFPPMLPRKLRVVRAKAFKRNQKRNPETSTRPTSKGVYRPKLSAEEKSAQGRAAKLFGKAGAARATKGERPTGAKGARDEKAAAFKTPESFVFEGHRASSKQGKTGLKLGGKKNNAKSVKPKNRSSQRAAAWKAGGGRKA